MKTPNILTNDEKGKQIFYNWTLEQQAQNVQFTNDKYNPIDAYYWDCEGDKFSVEIKYRRNSSTTYPTDLLEESKYNSLRATITERGCKNCLYFNIFSDGRILIYRLRDLHPADLQWTTQLLPTNELKSDYKQKKITYLPHSLAIKQYY